MSKKVYSMGVVRYFSSCCITFVAMLISDIADDNSAHYPDPALDDVFDGNDERRILVVTQKDVAIDSKAGPLYNPRLLVHTASA